ncbi:hypothetical protein Ciccas_012777, partial [Cichlidogyrus casuarinus]
HANVPLLRSRSAAQIDDGANIDPNDWKRVNREKGTYECKLCEVKLFSSLTDTKNFGNSPKSSQGNLRNWSRHLEAYHFDQYSRNVPDGASRARAKLSEKAKKSTSQLHLDRSFVMAFSREGIPLISCGSLLCGNSTFTFLSFCSHLLQAVHQAPPTAKVLSYKQYQKQANIEALRLRKKMADQLNTPGELIAACITTDGWTSKSMVHYQSLTLHYVTAAFAYRSVVLGAFQCGLSGSDFAQGALEQLRIFRISPKALVDLYFVIYSIY